MKTLGMDGIVLEQSSMELIERHAETARRACSDSETIHKKHNLIICPAPKSAVYFSLSREKASAN